MRLLSDEDVAAPLRAGFPRPIPTWARSVSEIRAVLTGPRALSAVSSAGSARAKPPSGSSRSPR
jgi:hypothetical protein